MDDHGKKKIAPIVVTVVMILYFVLYFGVLVAVVPGVLKFLLGIIPLLLGCCMLYVCIQRLKEIDGGEEDDLSKY
ncbi:MAG: hypothetical protein ACI4D7_11760 [Lachnospiraceae bacterium]